MASHEYDEFGGFDIADSGPEFDDDGSIHEHQYVEAPAGTLGGEPAYIATCRTCGFPTPKYAPRMSEDMVVERR